MVELPENLDPLMVYDVHSQPMPLALRDLWRGKAAFLVGSGPSLNEVDFRRIGERGVCSLGINNAAAYAPTRAFVCGDPVEKFHHGIFLDPGVIKFVPLSYLGKRVRAKTRDGEFKFTQFRAMDCPNVWGIERTADFNPEEFFSTTWVSWGVNDECHKRTGRPKCIFTFFTALRLLHYLGPRRIYLLGVDFSMPHTGEAMGNYAFRETGAAEGNHDHYRAAVQLVEELMPHLDKAGVEMFQTNPRSRLSCFQHVPYQEALEDCRSPVPQEPFDLELWYRRKGAWKP